MNLIHNLLCFSGERAVHDLLKPQGGGQLPAHDSEHSDHPLPPTSARGHPHRQSRPQDRQKGQSEGGCGLFRENKNMHR